jgi:hypothetical protein
MSYTNSSQGTALNAPVNARQLIDQLYVVAASLPNAANTVYTSGLDLLSATPYPTTDRVDVNIISAPGLGNNNKNINYFLQDSSDNGNWTNVAYLAAPLFQVLDNGNTNTNAANVVIKLMPGGRRYIRVGATGEANGGPGTNGLTTLQLLF